MAALVGAPFRSRPFHVMAKPTGAVCNLSCAYCFYLAKAALYPGGCCRMSADVQETFLREYLAAQPDGEVTVAWQGGEPTMMGLEFFRRAVELTERHRRPGQRVRHTLQTNGTLLSDAWGRFFAENGWLIGLSLDGPRDLHDAYRVDKAHRPTFDRARCGWEILARHGVETNILCTVHAANQRHPLETYRFFRDDLGARHLQFIPIVERVPASHPTGPERGDAVTDRSVDADRWGAFLIAIFDEWVQRDVGTVFVHMFDAVLARWLRLPSLCILNDTCGDAVALEHTGDVYSCDHFVDPEHLLGRVSDSPLPVLVTAPRQRAFGEAKRDGLPRYCRNCEVRFACNGECPKNRFTRTPDGEPGLNYLCAGYRTFLHHVRRPMQLMADLLRNGRYADEVMAILTRELSTAVAGAGRQDLCPCGSGRTVKRCHSRTATTRPHPESPAMPGRGG